MCTHSLGVVGRVHARAVKEEAHGVNALALAVAEGIHQLLEWSGALDLEEDFVVVVGDLDVQVLWLLRLLSTVVAGRRGSGGRHCV